MRQWTEETEKIITSHTVTEKTYASVVGSVGYGNYVKSLGGVFKRCYGDTSKISTIQQLQDRFEYVSGLMYIFKFCYWNGSTWWYWLNSPSKAFYSKKITTKGCRGGAIGQLCQGTDGRLRITCCNYGVDTLLRQCGIYSMKKSTVKDKSKLVPGDVIDLYRKSDGKWHHQIMVISIDKAGGKIWCADYGNRYIKTGKPLHYMSYTGTTAGGEYGTDKWTGRHRLTLKNEPKQEVIPTMNGIDIASYQAGIDLGKVPCDFVIIKATEGTGYVNPDCNRAYQSAKNAGKLIGLYHYSNGINAVEEADYFIKNIQNYIGEAVLALDWESYGNSAFGKKDVSYCKVFLDRIYAKTKVRPLIYMSQSVTNAHDWSSIAKDYGLWVARYASNDPTGYVQTSAYGTIGAWKYPAIFQYTSNGTLANWSGRLDLDIAYMDKSAWKKYATGDRSGAGEQKITKEVPTMPRTIKRGSTGKAVKVWQEIINVKPDGKFGAVTEENTKKFQRTHKDINGNPLTVDGVVGNKTWGSGWESI